MSIVRAIFSGVTANGNTPAVDGHAGPKQWQVFGTTTAGSGAATIQIQGSTDGVNWADLLDSPFVLTLGTASVNDMLGPSYDTCAQLRGVVSGISGTGASITLMMSY